MNIREFFWQKEYPIYLIANNLDCNAKTIIRLVEKYKIESHKKNGTRFIPQIEIIRLLEIIKNDCPKYFNHIGQID